MLRVCILDNDEYYELINGRLLHARSVVLNPLRVPRRRRDINPPSTEYTNVSYVTATTATTFGIEYSTLGVVNVTSSSRDVTSTLPLQSSDRPTTSPVNTDSLHVNTVNHIVPLYFIFYE